MKIDLSLLAVALLAATVHAQAPSSTGPTAPARPSAPSNAAGTSATPVNVPFATPPAADPVHQSHTMNAAFPSSSVAHRASSVAPEIASTYSPSSSSSSIVPYVVTTVAAILFTLLSAGA